MEVAPILASRITYFGMDLKAKSTKAAANFLRYYNFLKYSIDTYIVIFLIKIKTSHITKIFISFVDYIMFTKLLVIFIIRIKSFLVLLLASVVGVEPESF